MANCLYYKGHCTVAQCPWQSANKGCILKGKLASEDVRGEDGLLLQLRIVKVKGRRYEIAM